MIKINLASWKTRSLPGNFDSIGKMLVCCFLGQFVQTIVCLCAKCTKTHILDYTVGSINWKYSCYPFTLLFIIYIFKRETDD